MFDSDGGALLPAIAIGSEIHQRGFGTAVIDIATCNSSCALMWLAGTPRIISKSAKVGFHAAYTTNQGRNYESGLANAIIGRYLTLLDLPTKTVVFATMAPPDRLAWLTSDNYRDVGVELKVISDTEYSANSNSSKAADETYSWKNVGTWQILVDRTLDNNCYLASIFEDDTLFRIGIKDVDAKDFYVSIQNSRWTSLSEGEKHSLSMQFDRAESWSVPMKAMRVGGQPGLVGSFSDLTFWYEFIHSNVLNISTNGKFVAKLSLAGTSTAFDELGRCQRYQNSRKTKADPFAN